MICARGREAAGVGFHRVDLQRERHTRAEALRLADRLPLRAAMPGEGQLWCQLSQLQSRSTAVA